MNTDNQIIGKRIRDFREFQKLSREALAEKSNISTQFLADIEYGKKGMTVTTLRKICNGLHVSADSIVFGKEASLEDSLVEAMLKSVSEDKQEEITEIVQRIIKLI